MIILVLNEEEDEEEEENEEDDDFGFSFLETFTQPKSSLQSVPTRDADEKNVKSRRKSSILLTGPARRGDALSLSRQRAAGPDRVRPRRHEELLKVLSHCLITLGPFHPACHPRILGHSKGPPRPSIPTPGFRTSANRTKARLE